MMYEIYGIAYALGSRVLSGEVEFDEATADKLKEVQEGLTSVSATVGDFDVRRPATWVSLGVRLMKRAAGEGEDVDTWDWLEKRGHGVRLYELEALWRQTFLRGKRGRVFEDSEDAIWQVELPNGAIYYVELPRRGHGDREGLPAYHPNLPRDPLQLKRVLEGVGELFWRDRRGVLLDVSLKTQVFTDIELDGADYHGPLRECIERWRAFGDAGMRRNVLIQGKPGTGKSTFCLNAARELSERTLMLTAESCDYLGDSKWYRLLRVLQPTMVIMDDIDRLSESSLERKLRMFEEGYCDVPLILFTSNDLERLPQPLRRPGRIDQILEVGEPSTEALQGVVQRIATREEVEVSDLRLAQLVTLAREFSMAHVVEKLRRARIEGWDATPVEGDITFSRGYLVDEEDEDAA